MAALANAVKLYELMSWATLNPSLVVTSTKLPSNWSAGAKPIEWTSPSKEPQCFSSSVNELLIDLSDETSHSIKIDDPYDSASGLRFFKSLSFW